jgi:hypothetical protein
MILGDKPLISEVVLSQGRHIGLVRVGGGVLGGSGGYKQRR